MYRFDTPQSSHLPQALAKLPQAECARTAHSPAPFTRDRYIGQWRHIVVSQRNPSAYIRLYEAGIMIAIRVKPDSFSLTARPLRRHRNERVNRGTSMPSELATAMHDAERSPQLPTPYIISARLKIVTGKIPLTGAKRIYTFGSTNYSYQRTILIHGIVKTYRVEPAPWIAPFPSPASLIVPGVETP